MYGCENGIIKNAEHQRTEAFQLWCCRRIFRRRQWQSTPVLLPWKSHGWRNLVGCSPGGCGELDMIKRLHFHFSLSCIGEGNGNPLQCSCLENPRGRKAWWAAVYGVTQSRTQLKRLSSNSSSRMFKTSCSIQTPECVLFQSSDNLLIFHSLMLSTVPRTQETLSRMLQRWAE